MNFFVKRILSFVLMFCLILPLFACGSTEQPNSKTESGSNKVDPPSTTTEMAENPANLIVGTWITESAYVFYDGEEHYVYVSDIKEEMEEEYEESDFLSVFLEDGSVLKYISSIPVVVARWQIQGNTLVLTYIDPDEPEIVQGTGTFSIIKLDKDYLVLRSDASSVSENLDDAPIFNDGEYMDTTYRRQD